MKNYIKVFLVSLFMNSIISGSDNNFLEGRESSVHNQRTLDRIRYENFQGITYDELTLVPCLYYTWREPSYFLIELGVCHVFARYPLEMPIMISVSLVTTIMLFSMKYLLRDNPNAFAKGFSAACGVIFLGEALFYK